MLWWLQVHSKVTQPYVCMYMFSLNSPPIYSLQTKVQDRMASHQTYKEEIKPYLLKLFQNPEEEGTLPKTFCEVTITLIPKPNKLPNSLDHRESKGIPGKALDAGKDWGQKEKRASEDEMAGWHHRCNGHELGQTSEDGEGQGGLACCSSWVSKSRTQLGSWTPPPPVAGNLLCKWILKCLWSNILLCDKRHINTSLVNNVFKWPYYPKQSTDLMLSLSNYPWHFS